LKSTHKVDALGNLDLEVRKRAPLDAVELLSRSIVGRLVEGNRQGDFKITRH
jgi:hypothetical protein